MQSSGQPLEVLAQVGIVAIEATDLKGQFLLYGLAVTSFVWTTTNPRQDRCKRTEVLYACSGNNLPFRLTSKAIIGRSVMANEPVEKVPTRKKRSESGVPKWFLDPRSSLKRQIRRPFFLQLLPSDFFYRLNDQADRQP